MDACDRVAIMMWHIGARDDDVAYWGSRCYHGISGILSLTCHKAHGVDVASDLSTGAAC